MRKNHRLTAALCIGLLLAIGCAGLQASAQHKLSRKLLRLHVIANSDSREDQTIKLKVRDAVLQCEVGRYPTEAQLQRIEQEAISCLRAHGYGEKVQVSCERMYFDTRTYPDFALPAGYYDALRVVIGEGQGKNWWCVVYPSLCTGFAEAEAEGVLSEDEVSYIKKDGKKYVLRFKLQELISGLVHAVRE